MSEEVIWKVLEEIIPRALKQLSHIIKERGKKPKILAIGYISALFDTIYDYRASDFKELPESIGLERTKEFNILNSLGEVYYSKFDNVMYSILIEPITLREFMFMRSLPDFVFPSEEDEESMDIDRRFLDSIVSLNIRLIPLTDKSLEYLGDYMARLAVELSKLRGKVNAKVELHGVRNVKVPENGTVYRRNGDIVVVFHDFTELRKYNFKRNTSTLKRLIPWL